EQPPAGDTAAPTIQDSAIVASRQDVEAAIGRTDHVVLDVRSDLEFNGERFWPSGATADAGRAGHVPGAVSVPIDFFRKDDQGLRPTDELSALLESAGVTADK